MPDEQKVMSPREMKNGGTQHIRALTTEFSGTSLVEQDNGGLLITNVPMLAEGTWTDSAVGTPLYYSADILREYAANWIGNAGWSRHRGGVPRDATDKVAELISPRYSDGAVRGDILIHGVTQKSRDLIELIKRKLITYVSVEHGGKERYNPTTRQMEAESLEFYGFAFVEKGACQTCRVNGDPVLPENKPTNDDDMTQELETRIASLERELEALKGAAKPPETKPEKSEIERKLAALEERLKTKEAETAALSDRLKALESEGEAKTGQTQTRDLGEPINAGIVIDQKTGTIRRG